MRTPFGVRAIEMGLDSDLSKLKYSYIDKHSEIMYRQHVTIQAPPHQTNEDETDSMVLPLLAIFTKELKPNAKYRYCGSVSDSYQFIGNERLNQGIRDSLLQVGVPILTENTMLNSDLTRMRNEIIIQSSINTPVTGDILPVMVVNNSYNGSKAATLSFGISTYHNNERVLFSFNLGEMKQIHIANSNTQMASAISSYMQAFTENIVDMIDLTFQSPLTIEHMMGTLDLIENIGKKKRDDVSKLLEEMNAENQGQLPSAWQLFLAIARYSSFESNLNVKKMLESAAESVLVIPPKMFDVLSRLQN